MYGDDVCLFIDGNLQRDQAISSSIAPMLSFRGVVIRSSPSRPEPALPKQTSLLALGQSSPCLATAA